MAIPRGSPAPDSRTGIGEVESDESAELGNKAVFEGHQESWPGNDGCDDAHPVSEAGSLRMGLLFGIF